MSNRLKSGSQSLCIKMNDAETVVVGELVVRRLSNIICAALLLFVSGCHYFDFQYKPTGFSSTYHKYEVQEKIREWHARQEKQKRLAELQRRLVKGEAGQRDANSSQVVQSKMNDDQPAQ